MTTADAGSETGATADLQITAEYLAVNRTSGWDSARLLFLISLIFVWVSVALLAGSHHDLGLAMAAIASVVALATVRRAQTSATSQRETLALALEASGRRNEELERLGELAERLLEGTDLATLNRMVADAVAELIDAEGGAIMLVVEEGRFAKMVAGSGPLRRVEGLLIPMEHSLVGYVITNDEPLLVADVETDPRNFQHERLEGLIMSAAMVPLRSAGLVVGAVCAYNRRDRKPFTSDDRRLLESLGDQVVLGLDRATVLEELRRNEQTLASRNRELQRATRLKSEFLANMSHELRTPLNAIIGFSDLLLGEGLGPLGEQQKEFTEAVLRNGRHLLELINSVLDLSKIEAGRMTLRLDSCDIRAAIAGAVADTISLRSEKRQVASVEIADEETLIIVADELRVRQVLFNLLSNASKFSPDEGVMTIAAVKTMAPMPTVISADGALTGTLEAREVVWISVADSGIGISPGDVGDLFKEFSQVDTSASRAAQGTGLGLALCKRFVEMHGGQIGVESIPDRGSTFWFMLPVEGPPAR